MPASRQVPAAIAAPAGLAGEASEKDAKIHWQAVAGAAGYFVFRNGWHIATTTAATEYVDESSWLRPGLGYTYEVQAFAASERCRPAAALVVQTAARFPIWLPPSSGWKGRCRSRRNRAGVPESQKHRYRFDAQQDQNHRLLANRRQECGLVHLTGPLKPGEELTLISNGWRPQSRAMDGRRKAACPQVRSG